jgi:hypothetical protein
MSRFVKAGDKVIALFDSLPNRLDIDKYIVDIKNILKDSGEVSFSDLTKLPAGE